MLAWTFYALLISGIAALAAAAAEQALRLCNLPARGAWAGAMVASVVLPLMAWFGGGPPAPSIVLPAVGVGEAVSALGGAVGGSTATGGGDAVAALDNLLVWCWGVTAGAGLLWLGLSALRLHRSLARTPTRSVGDVDVHLTEDEGPACWMIPGLRTCVLLPAWLWEVEPEQRRLAVAHEREHLRRGDSLLTVAGYVLVAVAPWNLPLWWHLRRLRRAVEVDCDARVLNAGADPRSYGDLLLTVGGRANGPAWTALPLSNKGSQLEDRIRYMTAHPPERRGVRVAVFAVTALVSAIVACETEPPGPSGTAYANQQVSGQRPEFIPFDRAPKLQNADEVQQHLRDAYPERLRSEGVAGEAILWIYVSEEGEVLQSRIAEGSQHPALDQAAREVVGTMKFKPAMYEDEKTAVWLQQRVAIRAK